MGGKERDCGMAMNRKPGGTAKSMPVGLAMGWITQMLVTVLACVLLAMLILNGRAGWEAMGYGVMVILLLSAYLGAATACSQIGRRKLLICGISGGIYLLTLVAMVVLFFDGRFDAIWVPALLVAGGAATAALIHCREKWVKSHRRKRKRL